MKEFYGKGNKMVQDGNREIKNALWATMVSSCWLTKPDRSRRPTGSITYHLERGPFEGEIHELKIRFKLSKSKDLDLWENIYNSNTYPNRRFNLIIQEINNAKY